MEVARNKGAAKVAATQALDNRGILPADAVRLADVCVRELSGVWEVTVNGRFHGDYLREEHAVEAAALAVRLAVADEQNSAPEGRRRNHPARSILHWECWLSEPSDIEGADGDIAISQARAGDRT